MAAASQARPGLRRDLPESRRDLAFTRHRGPVTCAAAPPNLTSPTGMTRPTTVVSSGYDGALAITDTREGKIELLGYHEHLINRVAISESGRLAASPSSDYSVGLWDLEERRLLRFLHGHSDDVEDFAFIDDASGISVSRDRRVIVWDLATGAPMKTLEGHAKDVLSVAYRDGQIFTSGDDMTLRVWDLESGAQVRCWGPFEHETDTCAIDLRRGRAVLGCDDGVIRLFDIASGDPVEEIPAHTSGIKVVAVSPASGHIFSAAYDRRLLVWDGGNFIQRLELQPLASVWERSFNWTSDGSWIVAGTFDGTIAGWSADTGRRLFEVGEAQGNACLNEVTAAGERMVAVADDGYVRLGRLSPTAAAWSARREPRSGRVLANAVAADDAAGLIVTGGHDQTLRILGLDEELRELCAVKLRHGPINSVRILPADEGEHHIFAACYSGHVVRVSGSGEILARWRVHEGAVKSLCLVPQDRLGVSCSADGSVVGWSLDTGTRRMAFPAHAAIVNDLDVDPAGRRLASVGRDFVLDICSLEDGCPLQAFPLGRRSPKAVVFATDETVLVGDYWGHVIRVSLADGAIERRRIAENGISSLARAQDGRVFASSYDGAVYLLDAQTLEVLSELRAMWQRLVPPALGE